MKTIKEIEQEIFEFLGKNGESTAQEIGAALKITPKMLYKILNEMKNQKLIDEGKSEY